MENKNINKLYDVNDLLRNADVLNYDVDYDKILFFVNEMVYINDITNYLYTYDNIKDLIFDLNNIKDSSYNIYRKLQLSVKYRKKGYNYLRDKLKTSRNYKDTFFNDILNLLKQCENRYTYTMLINPLIEYLKNPVKKSFEIDYKKINKYYKGKDKIFIIDRNKIQCLNNLYSSKVNIINDNSKFIWKRNIKELIVMFDLLDKLGFIEVNNYNKVLTNLFLNKDKKEISVNNIKTERNNLSDNKELIKKIENEIMNIFIKRYELIKNKKIAGADDSRSGADDSRNRFNLNE